MLSLPRSAAKPPSGVTLFLHRGCMLNTRPLHSLFCCYRRLLLLPQLPPVFIVCLLHQSIAKKSTKKSSSSVPSSRAVFISPSLSLSLSRLELDSTNFCQSSIIQKPHPRLYPLPSSRFLHQHPTVFNHPTAAFYRDTLLPPSTLTLPSLSHTASGNTFHHSTSRPFLLPARPIGPSVAQPHSDIAPFLFSCHSAKPWLHSRTSLHPKLVSCTAIIAYNQTCA